MAAWYLYLLECEDGSIYTGIALDVAARFLLHRSGKGARYTRSHPPRKVLAVQKFRNRSLALRAEYATKRLSKKAKRALCRELRKKFGLFPTPGRIGGGRRREKA